jgi:hypothetical protein
MLFESIIYLRVLYKFSGKHIDHIILSDCERGKNTLASLKIGYLLLMSHSDQVNVLFLAAKVAG